MKIGYSSMPVVRGFLICRPGSSGLLSTPPPARWITMPTYPGFTYVTVFGIKNRSTMIPAPMPNSRANRDPPPACDPLKTIASSRSPTLVPLTMDSLLVTIGADQFPAGEAHQVRFFARPVDRALELRRAIDLPPVSRLTEPDADRRERDEHEIEKGGSRRQQRDEQHTLENDDAHTCA